MDLTDEEIKEFQDIYFKVYGEKISKEEAIARANHLLRFAAAVMGLDFEDLLNEVPNNRFKNFRFEPPRRPTAK